MSTHSLSAADMARLLDHWVEADIITGDQADRIRADAAEQPNPAFGHRTDADGRSRAGSLVTEAMGYLGGVIVAVGMGLALGRFWPDLSTTARVGLTAVVASLLLAAGAAVTDRLGAAGGRLRSVLWLGSSVAYFSSLALLAAEWFGWSGDRLLAFAATGCAVVSVGLWVVHRRLLQQASALGFVVMAAAAWTSMITHSAPLPGVAAWAAGVAWAVAGALDAIRPARPAMALGAIAAIVGSVWIEGEYWGTWIALATVAGLVAYAVLDRDLVLLAVASLGTLVVLPELVVRYFPGVLSAALTLIVVGLLLVATAVFTARRRPRARA
jgi:hypothetical protein